MQSIVNQHKQNIIINVENNIRKTHQKEITNGHSQISMWLRMHKQSKRYSYQYT